MRFPAAQSRTRLTAKALKLLHNDFAQRCTRPPAKSLKRLHNAHNAQYPYPYGIIWGRLLSGCPVPERVVVGARYCPAETADRPRSRSFWHESIQLTARRGMDRLINNLGTACALRVGNPPLFRYCSYALSALCP